MKSEKGSPPYAAIPPGILSTSESIISLRFVPLLG
jgi:hypothetical protein